MRRWFSLVYSLLALIIVCIMITLLHQTLPGSDRFYGRVNECEVNVSALFYSEEPHAALALEEIKRKRVSSKE